jgi:SulP family sulfate permease
MTLRSYLPILDWGARYDRTTFSDDAMAAVIVTIMLIPQSLAYALLAGLPAEVGLYASVAPLILYGVFGTSRALSVGPVAVVSLMTAAAIGRVAAPGSPEFYTAALVLALLSGLMLTAMGFVKLGFMANFLSHPVISGFISASGVIIAASQLQHILGVRASGHNLHEIVVSLIPAIPETNFATLAIGVPATAFLFWVRGSLKPLLMRMGASAKLAGNLTKVGPVVAVVATTLALYALGLDKARVSMLATSALLISLVGFVESVSVAQTLAAKRRQRISPDQELIGLGASNLGAAFTGGFPVTGGFSRSVVNFDAGAATPAAGILTAVFIAVATMTLTPLLYFLPKATLAATIIVAVLALVDLGALRHTWSYSRSDFAAQAATIVLTLGVGVEAGIVAGVGLSIFLHLYRTSKPHYAIVGQVPGTEHFRNVKRHEVVTAPDVLTLRVDESLYFPNARFLEDHVYNAVASNPAIRHVVLMCPAVNMIDASALESLEAINERLRDADVRLHLSEVKGPVMDRLARAHFLHDLSGHVYLTQYDAMKALAPQLTIDTAHADRCETQREGFRSVWSVG